MLLLLAIACTPKGGDTAPTVDPLSWAFDEVGPYNVGFRSWERTYEPPVGESPRTIVINVWYPTEATDGEDVRYLDLYEDDVSLGEAEPAPSPYGDSYPVHVHSHGSQGWGGSSAFLSQRYASHGWVVVAPDHTDNTFLDNADPRPTAHYAHRPLDVQQALDALEALPAEDPLSAADTRRAVMSGHSFGCYSTWAVGGAAFDASALEATCLSLSEGCTDAEVETFLSGDLADPRVVASIPMAGGYSEEFFGEGGAASAHAPFLIMTGSADDVGMADDWPRLGGVDRTWIDLAGGCHQTFALGVCDTLDPALGYEVVNAYALAFGRAHVLGDQSDAVSAALDGSAPVADVVTFQRETSR